MVKMAPKIPNPASGEQDLRGYHPPVIILLYVAKGILHIELSALLTDWVNQKENCPGWAWPNQGSP